MSAASPARDASTSGSEPHRRRSHLDVVLDQAEHLLGMTSANRHVPYVLCVASVLERSICTVFKMTFLC